MIEHFKKTSCRAALIEKNQDQNDIIQKKVVFEILPQPKPMVCQRPAEENRRRI